MSRGYVSVAVVVCVSTKNVSFDYCNLGRANCMRHASIVSKIPRYVGDSYGFEHSTTFA